MLILVTGATGKVGRHFIAGLLDDPRFSKRAFGRFVTIFCCETDRVEVVRGSITERHVIAAALDGVTHFVPLPPARKRPTTSDVTVKGLFWLLEEFVGVHRSPVYPDRRRCPYWSFIFATTCPSLRTRHTGHIPEATRCRRSWKRSCWSSSASSTTPMGAVSAHHGSWRRTTSNIRCRSVTTSSGAPTGRHWFQKPMRGATPDKARCHFCGTPTGIR